MTVKFKDAATPDQVTAPDAALAALPGQIDLIRRTRHGRDLGERPTNADYALVSEFGTAEDVNTYLEHPAHQAVTRDHLLPLAESWHSVQVVGYDD